MTMNKFFTGLIALVAGVALSAGSAFATRGYTIGDAAGMKLIPFYETGGMLFTAIGVQNMSGLEATTAARNAAVTAAQDALDALAEDALDARATAQGLLDDAMEAMYTEHLFFVVRVHNAMGMMMMEDALCLAENQFGYVVITGDGMAESIPNRGLVLSMDADEIPAYGYVTIRAENVKFTSCEGEPRTGLMGVSTADDAETDAEFVVTPGDNDPVEDANGMLAAWTILQDVGTGFFGTEIPSSTITTMAAMDDPDTADMDESTTLACYGDVGGEDDVFNGRAGDEGGPYLCGLIPERHDNTRTDGVLDVGDATVPAMVTARFDVAEGTENDVYVWLSAGEDAEDDFGDDRRSLSVTTMCEDGMMAQIPTPGDVAPGSMDSMAMVPVPNRVNMIDPAGDVLGPYTSQCDGGRGVLRFAMPDESHAGMVWTHISQRGKNFRLNMPGYSMASPDMTVTAP